jgi:glycosyltransferase involved in cell wall biosynthesis
MHCSDVETFGVALIEALACGLPVVATRSGGPDEVITPEVGILVDRGDVAGLAQALRATRSRLAREADRGTDSWKADCRRFAHQNYSYEAFAAQLEPILLTAVARARGALGRVGAQDRTQSA